MRTSQQHRPAFSDSDIHELAEAVERAALDSLHAAAPDTLKAALGMRLENVNGAVVSTVAEVPSIVLNRAQGLGVSAPARRSDVDSIARIFAEAGVGRYFLHLDSSARPAELSGWLREAGLEPARGWMKFVRSPDLPPQPARSGLEIREIDEDLTPDFGRIVAAGFDLGDHGAELIACLAGQPGWYLFMSFAGNEPAGTGALFVHGGVGWFDWGATWPTFRQRGSQNDLLAARIRKAKELGCRILITTTGEWVEGDPQHSYRNIERAGFQPIYARANYAPPRP